MKKIVRTLMIEINNSCNLKCRMCMIKNRKKPFMEMQLYKNILKQWEVSGLHFDLFMPFFRGEPLLHPQFDEMLKLFCEKNKDFRLAKSIAFDTNATLLDEKISNQILTSKQFSTINFSIDAAQENTYKDIRRGGDLNDVINNIQLILRLREEYKLEYPKFRLQFIVMPENIDEAEDFIYFWKSFYRSLGNELDISFEYDTKKRVNDSIFFRPCMSKDKKKESEDKNLYDALYKRLTGNIVSKAKNQNICSGPFSHIVITSDGLVLPCCVDNEDKLIIGDIEKETLSQIVNGKELNRLRRLHLSQNKSKIEVCKNCPGQFFPVIDDELLKELIAEYEK